MNLTCPVCNKVGLPDYRTQHITCPQCNSDLKPYLLLHTLSNVPKTNRLAPLLLTILGLSTIILLFLLLSAVTEKNQLLKENKIALQGNRNTPSAIKTVENNVPASLNKAGIDSTYFITYNVKKGDCPSVIARFFYNDWRMYKKIEEDNNLTPGYVLKIGQRLIIKLNKK